MTRVTFNLPKMKAARFEGCPRYNLTKAYEILLGPMPEGISDADLIAALQKASNMQIGGTPQIAPHERSASGKPQRAPASVIAGIGRIPNLSSSGVWEGRRRMVQLGPTGTAAETVTLGWDAMQRWAIKVPDVVSMPWPYWEIVRTRVHVDDLSDKVRKWARNPETEQLEVTTKPKRTVVINHVDMGDAPGTEELPTSYKDFFEREADKSAMFKKSSRQALIMIHNKLTDPKPPTYFQKLENVEIRQLIANLLDPRHQEMLTDEIYGADMASAD